ncbi:hypothetical protein AMJ80_12575 [bacterium SM23_31]|nr:MAG: hypothetical protein AMJ80_12575 [bacterium SM23_31]
MTDLSRFNYKKFSLEDRHRLRELRKKLRRLWFPPMENDIRAWRRRSGINSSRGLKEFSELSRHEKERFFTEAEVFIRLIENASSVWYRRNFPTGENSLMRAYFTLDLENYAPLCEVRKRYHRLVLKSHPDRGGNPEEFIKIINAYRQIYANSAEREALA